MAAFLILALAGSPARAELALGAKGGADRTAGIGTGLGALEGRVAARCFQQGREVLALDDFAAAEVGTRLRELSLGLQGGAGKRSAVIVPLADSLCLLTISP